MKKLFLTLFTILYATDIALAQEPFDGVTMISPLNSTTTYMLDIDEAILQSWNGANHPGSFAYLLPDGSIMRPCMDPGGSFSGGGVGGRIQRFNSNGALTWDYYFSTYDYQQHHDIQPMPNGNVLVIAWERKTQQEAIAAGRTNINGEMWPTLIVEVEPVGSSGGNIVWEWHLWDHLVQDADPGKPNYGVVSEYPELIDINYGNPGPQGGDWIHANSIDYNEQLDQIVFSSRAFNEIYIIDHSTTTAEAAGHTGGNSGMGGDILYRWGNPIVYDRGSSSDQYFYVVHGVNWIDCGMPGAGNILTFNNGDRSGSGNDYSTVDEIVPPVDEDGNYHLDPGGIYGPAAPIWTYGGPGWYAGPTQCGAFRLPNGNTLITATESRHVFEVTEAGTTVWNYVYSSRIARGLRYWILDFDDFEVFTGCMTGPGGGSAGCETHEVDCDGDIDMDDFIKLQDRFGEYVGP